MMVLPQDCVQALRLTPIDGATVRYANGTTARRSVYGIVMVEMEGRRGHFDVLAEAEGTQPLIGQIVLEQLDLIVDPARRVVLPNPRSPDMPMIELL
jgi:predicted aspartyl protease